MTPKERLAEAMRELGLTVVATFIPFSKSRNARPREHVPADKRTLNWRVELRRSELRQRDDEGKDFHQRIVLTTDYSAGIGHAPSYPKGGTYRGLTLDVAKALELETEHGKRVVSLGSVVPIYGKAIEIDACDVVYSLVSDSDAIDCASFEEWASNLGYDTDSRSAEKTYRACLDIALKLRAAVGDDGLTKLRNACQDY